MIVTATAVIAATAIAAQVKPNEKLKNERLSFRLLLIRMFTVGAIIDRPQTSQNKKRATNGRSYKQISAEILFPLPICVIMEPTKSLPPRGRWHGVAVTEGACVTLGLD